MVALQALELLEGWKFWRWEISEVSLCSNSEAIHYRIQTSCVTLACQFSKLPLKRAGTKKLLSQSTPLDIDFSDVQVTELLGKHPQGIFLSAKG